MPAYLDHAAATGMSARAMEAMAAAAQHTGNPSSLHAAGRSARSIVEDARETVARAFDAVPGDVVFTAGATEANNLAVIGMYRAARARDPRRRLLIINPTEHHAVLDAVDYLVEHESAMVRWLAVDADGVVNIDDLKSALATAGSEAMPALVAIMAANNETGTIQPMSQIAQACDAGNVPWHCDAVQAAAWMRLSFSALGCATMAVSAHKLGGPVGVGALMVRAGVAISPTSHGGGQERKLRSGTVNAAAAAGFAAAVDERVMALDAGAPSAIAQLRESLLAHIADIDPAAVFNGGPNVLPSIVNVTFPGCEADALLMLLDADGVYCSLGAACTAGVPEPSHVLLAMGASQSSARSSLRFSFGLDSSARDIAAVASALPTALSRARAAAGATSPTSSHAATPADVDPVATGAVR